MESETTWFIGGASRSGSTLLSEIISHAVDGVNVGELHLLWRSLRSGRICTCGTEMAACPFWSEVKTVTLNRTGLTSVDAAAWLESLEPRQREIALKGVKTTVRMPVLNLRRATERAIREVANSRIIVDSSKTAGAMRVAMECDIKFRGLHLVRDPRAVAHSMAHPRVDPSLGGAPQPEFNAPGAGLRWTVTNTALERLAARDDSIRRVRYEDLVADPERTLSFLRVGDTVQASQIESPTNHSVAGNPGRFNRSSALILDERWVTEMSRRAACTVTGFTYPLLRLYGYQIARK